MRLLMHYLNVNDGYRPMAGVHDPASTVGQGLVGLCSLTLHLRQREKRVLTDCLTMGPWPWLKPLVGGFYLIKHPFDVFGYN